MDGILQYLLGAGILSVFLTQIVTGLRSMWERKRERDGFLRILFDEVSQNQEILHVLITMFQSNLPDPKESAVKALEDEPPHLVTWEGTKLGLAKHLDSEDFAVLADYYRNLTRLKEKPTRNKNAPIIVEHRDERLVKEIHKRGGEVMEIIKRYVPDVTARKITMGDLARN